MERKIGLDLVRAVAIIIVLEGHSRSIINSVFPQLNLLGYSDGVDIFFVLSGFLIGGILIRNVNNDLFDLKHFLFRRWYRTIPNFVIALLVSVLFYYILNGNHLINGKLILQTSFFVQNFLPPFTNFTFFSEAWSLAVEEHFYLIFALALFIISKYYKENRILLSILALFCISLLSRIIIYNSFKISDYDTYNSCIRTITPCRFDSLAVGVFIAYYKDKFPTIYNERKLKVALFLFGIALCVCFDRTHLIYETHYTPMVIIFFSLLFSIGVGFTFPLIESIEVKFLIFNYGIKFISKISYSMYLFHNFIFAQPISQFVYGLDSKTKIYFYLIYWLFIVSISYLTYSFVEKPFLRMREKKYPERLKSI